VKSLKAQKGNCTPIHRSDLGNYIIQRQGSHCFRVNLAQHWWVKF